MGNEKGIYCVKGYGTILFVQGARNAFCPISGYGSWNGCDVITQEEAMKIKQVKIESEKKLKDEIF